MTVHQRVCVPRDPAAPALSQARTAESIACRLVCKWSMQAAESSAMNPEIGSCEAKTRLPGLLREVRKGKSFTITNRGEPVAELVPVRRATDQDAARAVEGMRAFMRSHRVTGVDIKALIEEGRD